MSDIRKYKVEQTSRLDLLDAGGKQMYADKADGTPDETKPMVAVVYGPGSKIHAEASQERSNRMIDKLKKKGKTDTTEADERKQTAIFLAKCTQSFENVTYDDLEGKKLFEAVYADREIGFIAEQVGKHLGDWENFSTPSTKI